MSKRILFIGNSYTYFNDMPQIFAGICKERGADVKVESLTWGDYTFARFLDREDELGEALAKKLATTGYDYIVIQEYSTFPAVDPGKFYEDAAEFSRRIRRNGAVPVFYETWARRDGDEILSNNGWTHESMQKLLHCAYENAAARAGGIVVYAGDRFSEAYRAGIEVFDTDGSHPTATGSRIVASEFYRVLFGDNFFYQNIKKHNYGRGKRNERNQRDQKANVRGGEQRSEEEKRLKKGRHRRSMRLSRVYPCRRRLLRLRFHRV